MYELACEQILEKNIRCAADTRTRACQGYLIDNTLQLTLKQIDDGLNVGCSVLLKPASDGDDDGGGGGDEQGV